MAARAARYQRMAALNIISIISSWRRRSINIKRLCATTIKRWRINGGEGA